MTILYSTKIFKILKIFSTFAKLFGANIFAENYRMSWITWSVIVLVNMAIGFSLHTVYTIIAYKNDWSDILKLLCMFGTGVQGYVKLINAIKRREDYIYLITEITEIYEIYEHKTEQYQKHLKDSVLLQKKIIQIILGLYTIVPIFLIGIPIFRSIYFQRREHIMHFFIPFVDATTDIGYYMTMAIHVASVVAGCYGNFVSDYWCFLTISHIPLIKNILKCKFNDLNKILEQHPEDSTESKKLLRDIFQWHQKYKVFIEISSDSFFLIIFVQIATAFIGICCTTVCLFMGTWAPAPIFLLYSFMLMYIFCGLGNLVEISNDDIILLIYDSQWYNFTIPEQKMIQIMLREAQKQKGLTIGNISPLSLSTALQLTKTIYSVAMMLQQSLK